MNQHTSRYGTDLMQVCTRECELSEHSHLRVEYFPNVQASGEGTASRVSTRTLMQLLQKHIHTCEQSSYMHKVVTNPHHTGGARARIY